MKRYVAAPIGEKDIIVDLTEKEIAKTLAEQAEREFAYQENEWKKQLSALDVNMPRSVEDVMGVLTAEQFDALPKITKDLFAAKAQLRLQRPQKT